MLTIILCPQIYRIGKGVHIQDGKVIRNNASTIYDTSQKTITPMVLLFLLQDYHMQERKEQIDSDNTFSEAHICNYHTWIVTLHHYDAL